MLATKTSLFRFADVEVREREFCLIKAGHVEAVEPKAFRVLLFLLHNPQKLITKEELLNAVWGETAVSENSLTRSIALLRKLLGDDTHQSRFIETVATVGYRFVCPVEVVEDANGGLAPEDSAETRGELAPNGEEVADKTDLEKLQGGASWIVRRRWLVAAVVVAVGAFAGGIWYLLWPLPRPYVTAYNQITHDGHDKTLGGTDGSRVYFGQLSPNFIAQVAIAGGEIAQVPVAESEHYRLYLNDVSPDGSSLLITAEKVASHYVLALWNVQILGGSVRRVGEAHNAVFSPDGSSIAYSTEEGEVWTARSDGTEARKLTPAGHRINSLAWSPDGSTIRFGRDWLLWEMSSSGANLHEFLPNWRPSSRKCCGRWTLDGRFYLSLSGQSRIVGNQIWVLDERRGSLRRTPAEPFQLTTGPINWSTPIPARDGKSIFSVGRKYRGELYRFDTHNQRFEPFLGGISAEGTTFSKDGKSVAYVTYPDGILWKANGDGGNPVQLTEPPLYPQNPRWSPDGSQIAFFANGKMNIAKSYIVSSAGGGTPRRLLPEESEQDYDPTWSPDGRRILFGAGDIRDRQTLHLSILDLATHQVSVVPGSTGKWSPRWSPDGRYIASLSWERPELKVFDFKTEKWSTLAVSDDVNYPGWSQDSQYIYSLVISPGGQDVYRVRVTGGKPERIVNLKDWHFASWDNYSMTLDPTDAPLLLRDVGSNDIYALKLEEK